MGICGPRGHLQPARLGINTQSRSVVGLKAVYCHRSNPDRRMPGDCTIWLSCALELTGDMWGPNLARKDGIDLRYPANELVKAGGKFSLCGKGFEAGSGYTIANHEGVGDGSGKGYNLSKFRILVEATPKEIAEGN